MSKELRIIPRREFLEYLITGTAGLVATVALDGPAVFRLTPTQEIPYFSNYPHPGWLETRTQRTSPSFIDTKEGHKEYLRNIVLNDPLFNDPDHKSGIMQKAYTDLFFSNPPRKHPLLGTMFLKHIYYAADRLKELFPVKDFAEPTVENVVHTAITSFAALYSPYFSQNEIRDRIGISLDDPGDDTSIWWLTHAYQNIPSVYPEDSANCGSKVDAIYRCEGVDRAVHFAQHLFIAHNYIYGSYHSLPFINRIPLGVFFALLLGNNLEEKAKILSHRAGEVWEAMETRDSLRGYNIIDDNGKPISTGFLDPLVVNDLKANSLGTRIALDLSDGLINTPQKTGVDISGAIIEMNQQAVNRVSQNAENIFSLPG